MKTTAVRYHDISCGHRVSGHESKCAQLHGHNYRIHFHCEGRLDAVGRVLDFAVIKTMLCRWLEEEWDHRFLIWQDDPVRQPLVDLDRALVATGAAHSLVITPFNPTAENMAEYLLNVIGPYYLKGSGVQLTRVVVEETRKCSAACELGDARG